MKRMGRPCLLPVMILCLLSPPLPAQVHYRDLKYRPLGELDIPSVRQVRLDNGITLFLLEDHELPLINLSGRLRVGSIYEPADKLGLASITGTVMRSGGTLTRSGDGIDELLESIAASVEIDISDDVGYVSLSVLKEDLDTALAVLADVLANPAFPEAKIELAKIQERTAVSRRNDDPGAIAFREFRKLIYGADSVYARHPEYQTIENISRRDLSDFHRKYFHPNNTMLALWGDFDSLELVKRLEQIFAEWQPREIDFPAVPEVRYSHRSSVNLIRREDVNQSHIYVGHIGGLMSDPDYYALILMNRVLGHGFTSRLFREIRSRQGLAYSVFGSYSADFDHPGLFYVSCQTGSGNTVRAIRALTEEVRRITETEVSEEELAVAKESYLNSFVFKFDSRREMVNRIMMYAYYGYPLDFLQSTREKVEKISRADIAKVARKHLKPDLLQILTMGNPESFDEPLSVLGTVNEIDVSIPTADPMPPPEAASH